MRLSKTQARILDALQNPMSRRELATAIKAHPTYCARALKEMVDAGLVELINPQRAFLYRAKGKMALVPFDSTAPVMDGGAQGAG